ncbi:thioredoxin-like protein [Tilletiaria anomala UBC 951]|uniref:Glutathione S-transferase kappa n=1 Tax=Tilletiaria anomala (strain ATCC 24038 / CBS 436.72 / UBC 951) TaxID=1037660 RepID=A0A066VMK8_TILAU|nr:thioredoxin-like protein [Tilletiaria anomala UBC 951]KDN41513.1 thioredoxin-like protein [Tilletiaria anomala UBC 951]
MSHKFIFHYDTVSPWAYVAFEVLKRYRKQWNLDLVLEPVNLGYIMHFSGNRPPIAVANKGIWMNEDMDRASKFYGVTLNRSPRFPVNTQGPQCLLRLMKDDDPSRLEAATDIFFKASWVHDQEVGTTEQLRSLVSSLYSGGSGSDASKLDALLLKSQSKEYKAKVKEEARQLVEQGGCFGMPWMVITRVQDGRTTRWFGSDRFEQIAAFLEVPYKGARGDGSIAKL